MRVPFVPFVGVIASALVLGGCADDSVNDDLFAEATDPTLTTGAPTDGRSGGSQAPSAGDPSGGAGGSGTNGGVSASGESTGTSGGAGNGTGSGTGASESGGAGGGGSGSESGGGSGGGSGSGGGGTSGGGVGASDLSADVHLCGKLDAFAAAGAQAGACTISGITLPIAAGITITGQLLATVGANVCLDAKLDTAGKVQASSALSLDLVLLAGARTKTCGKVSAYAASSASTRGEVAIGGASFDIAAGASVAASAKLVVGASVCVDASLDRAVAIVAATVSAN